MSGHRAHAASQTDGRTRIVNFGLPIVRFASTSHISLRIKNTPNFNFQIPPTLSTVRSATLKITLDFIVEKRARAGTKSYRRFSKEKRMKSEFHPPVFSIRPTLTMTTKNDFRYH